MQPIYSPSQFFKTKTYLVKISLLGIEQNSLTAPLQRGQTPPNGHTGYDTNQSDCETSTMQELWGMWRTSSLPLLPDPLWLGVVVPERVRFMGQEELFDL